MLSDPMGSARKTFLLITVIWCVFLPLNVQASTCLGSLVHADEILVISHERYYGGSSSFFVYIEAPVVHEQYPFSHMVISRGELDVSANLETHIENGKVKSRVDGIESELINWNVSVFYKQKQREGEDPWGCRKAYIASGSLQHNKTRNEMDGTDVPPIR